MSKLIAVLILLVGLINFYPLVGVLSADRLHTLYGISIVDNNLLIAMKHRAVLLGIIGALIMYSAFKPMYQPAAISIAAASMLSYIAIAASHPGANELIKRVIYADVAASLVLLVAVVLILIQRTSAVDLAH